MGLWSFVKGKGKQLFGGDEEAELNGGALQDEIADLGLDATGLEISVEGDTVNVIGQAVSQDMKEKVILAVGNVKGVAAVHDDVPSATEPVFHTVVPGDTLWAIAEKVLGQGSRYQDVFEANTPMLSHPDRIYPGQVLRIPQD